jgi:2-oxoglutarate ferredoxin oxidoreductase subunit alpha
LNAVNADMSLLSEAARTPGPSDLSIALTGSGGAGVMTAGNLLLEAAARAGCYGLMVRSSGPQIRGGEAAALLRIAKHPVECLGDRFDVLIAVDWQNVHRFAQEIPVDAASLLIGDPDQGEPPEVFMNRGSQQARVPFKKTAKAIPGSWPNMIMLGLAAAIVGLPAQTVEDVVRKADKGRGHPLAANLDAVKAGFAAAQELPVARAVLERPRSAHARWLITGNQAAGYGALRGGIRFVAGYPITPATEVLEWMAPMLTKLGGALVQAEDELASINMIIGASFGGVPALTATAGPGLSLMSEAIGLAVAAEVPVVVLNVMRGGPSTGIPAKGEQSDLNIAINGLHGDAPHLVLAPNSIADCLGTTQWAVHLAEQLQAPAIVLSDQFLGQARAVIDRPADLHFMGGRSVLEAGFQGYRRYVLTESGISPMAIPGTPTAAYTADGLEHNERGTPSSQSTDHAAQLDKRERKLLGHDFGELWAEIEGDGDIAVVTFGSCTGPAREARSRLAAQGIPTRLVSVRLLAPAQPRRLAAALAGVKRVLVVEQNHSGQFLHHLRAESDLPGEVRSLRHPGPLPIRATEICREITEWSRI